jgi:hypothetical protein
VLATFRIKTWSGITHRGEDAVCLVLLSAEGSSSGPTGRQASLRSTPTRSAPDRKLSQWRGSMFCDVGHDLPHFHRLARGHFLNADDDLVVRRSGGALHQVPKTLQQLVFVF